MFGQVNPLIISDMRSRMRGRRAFIALTLFLILVSCVAGGIYAAVYSSSMTYGRAGALGIQYGPVIGKAIFAGITLLLLSLISFIAPGFTAGALAGERERKTYDVLVVTPLRPHQIVLGKLGAVFGFLMLLILASIPILSMALLFGGVAPVEVLIAALALLVTTLAFGALGLYISSLMRSTLVAMVIAYGIGLPFVYGLPFLLYYFSGIVYLIAPMLTLDPAQELLAIVTMYGLGFLLSINPISAAILTSIAAASGKGYFFFSLPIGSTNLWLVSPWLVYVIFHLLLAWLLIVLTIRRVAQISEH